MTKPLGIEGPMSSVRLNLAFIRCWTDLAEGRLHARSISFYFRLFRASGSPDGASIVDPGRSYEAVFRGKGPSER
jgi:hypothetical protein